MNETRKLFLVMETTLAENVEKIVEMITKLRLQHKCSSAEFRRIDFNLKKKKVFLGYYPIKQCCMLQRNCS